MVKITKKAIQDLKREIKKQERDLKNKLIEIKKINKNIKHLEDKKKKEELKKNKKIFKSLLKSTRDNIKKADKLVAKSQKKFEKKLSQFKKYKYICVVYLFVEADKNADGDYLKTYNFGNINKVQHADETKYTLSLEAVVELTQDEKKNYQVDQFYNDIYDGISFIKDFLKIIKSKDEDLKNTIDIIEISRDIKGFKIVQAVREEIKQVNELDLLNMKLKNDTDTKFINNYYTKYIMNINSSSLKDLLEFEYNNYIKANFRPNSCFLTAIINKCYNRFNRIKSDGKRRNMELTYSYLCNLLEIEDKPRDNAVSILEVVEKFCKKFNFISLYVYDSYMKLLLIHKATCSDNVSIRVMVKGHHIYELNNNLKELEQQQVNTDDDETKEIIVSNKYKVIEEIQTSKEIFINNDEGEKKIIQEIKAHCEDENLSNLKIITVMPLQEILFKLLESSYTPKIYFTSQLYKLQLIINKLFIEIIPADNNPILGQLVCFNNIEEYKRYNEAFIKFYSSVIKKEYISDYHPSVLDIEDYYKIKPVVGYINDCNLNKPYSALDENKAYTECAMNINYIPVFNYFDTYQEYKGEKIDDLNYYIIEVLENTIETSIIFDSKFSRTYGYVLKKIQIKHKILYYRKPFNIEEVNYKTAVEELYNQEINDGMKKAIVNITTGLLEKKENKAELSKIFDNYDEANYYAIKYNGKILPVVKEDYESKEEYNPLDDEIILTTKTITNKILYCVNVVKKETLINRLTPIKEMIYYNQRIKLYEAYKKLNELGFNITGIKTDCLMYDEGDESSIPKHFNLSNKIGDFKIERFKYLVNKKLEVIQNELVKPEIFNIKDKTFNDEFNTKEINEYLKDNKKVIVKGEYPGVGKSTIAKNYDKNALFICPYNRLCQQLICEGFNSITYCKLFGLVGSDEEMKHIKGYNIDEYNTIVFDEIFLYEPQRLKRISELMKQYPNKNYIATGDMQQRDPVGFKNSAYINRCMNILFNNHIILTEIKRFKNNEDKEKLKLLKKDIFNNDMKIKDICKKYNIKTITSIKDITTKTNICLFKFRCDIINNHVNKNILKNKEEFQEGFNIICRKYEKKLKLNTNYIYKIMKITKKDITIKDEVENKEYNITPCILKNNFKLPYALTCDSVQGLSFREDEKITVLDSNTPYVDRKFLWTAITRARKIENINIFIHNDTEIKRLTESRIKLYLTNKINGYKQQDKKAHRGIDNDKFVDDVWILEEVVNNKFCCLFCKKNLEIYINENSDVISNITVDRKNNKLAHHKSNSQICCLDCNRIKGNRY